MALQLPGYLKRRIHASIRTRVRSTALAASALGLGFLVSVFEFACTGQVYLPTLAYLARLGDARAVPLLAVYNLGFIAPLVAVFAASWAGVTSRGLTAFFQRHLVAVKAALAVFFAGAGRAHPCDVGPAPLCCEPEPAGREPAGAEVCMLASIPFPSWIRPEIIPGLPIRWYGLMYLVAFAVTYLLFMLQVQAARPRGEARPGAGHVLLGDHRAAGRRPGRGGHDLRSLRATTSAIPCRSSCRSRWSTGASG